MTTTWVPESMDERAEVEFRSQMTAIREQVGPEVFDEFALRLGLQHEALLRATATPDHPMLKLIDAHRAKQARGFE